jgi:hypothetical protein
MDKKLRNKLIKLQTCLEETIQVLRKVLAEEEIVAKLTENVSPLNEEIVEEITTEIIRIAEQLNAEQLNIANSREEGKAILAEYIGEHRNVKERLLSLAKYLKIPVGKLNNSDLTEKIIQETIGYRIDAMIIQEHKWDK